MSKITKQELEALADAFYEHQTGYKRQNSTFALSWLVLTRKCVTEAGIKIKDEPGNYPKPPDPYQRKRRKAEPVKEPYRSRLSKLRDEIDAGYIKEFGPPGPPPPPPEVHVKTVLGSGDK